MKIDMQYSEVAPYYRFGVGWESKRQAQLSTLLICFIPDNGEFINQTISIILSFYIHR